MKQWKNRNRRIMSDDELLDSILDPKAYRDKLKLEREAAIQADKDIKPDFSQSNLEPMEIKKVKFDYVPQDYSRGRNQITEDEIIDSVLNPKARKQSNKNIVADLHANVSPETRQQWRDKIAPNNKSTKKGITVE
jgi:hypothetical protein